MSLHASLKIDSAGSQQRSVLSRIERIKDLMKKGLWVQNQGVTALPKTKVLKVKAKKKAVKKEGEGEATSEAGATASAGTAAPAAKAPVAKAAAPAKKA